MLCAVTTWLVNGKQANRGASGRLQLPVGKYQVQLVEKGKVLSRGDLEIIIDGVERLAMVSNTIMPEAACTSTQVHLQVSPDDFAGYWNAAQAIAGIQVALCANSPFLFGKHLVLCPRHLPE